MLQPTDVYRMDDTPAKTGAMVHAEWQGHRARRRSSLIAHMDTVYLRGMLKDQPFRVDGDRAYGLGIADDKQGVALILHTVAMLNKLRLQGLRHADRARSTATRRSARPARAARSPRRRRRRTPCSRSRAAAATAACAWRPAASARRISPSKASSSHAGARPEGGINALYELAHQILQLKRPVAERQGPEAQLDGRAGRDQPQRHPGAGDRAGRRAGAARRRFRPAAGRAAGARADASSSPTPRCSSRSRCVGRRWKPLPHRAASPHTGQAIYDEIGLPMKVSRRRHRRRHRRRVRCAADHAPRSSRASA